MSTFTVLQSTSQVSTTSNTKAFTSVLTPGTTIVCIFRNGTTTSPSTISDGTNGKWLKVRETIEPTDGFNLSIWWFQNQQANTAVTVTATGTNLPRWIQMEIDGPVGPWEIYDYARQIISTANTNWSSNNVAVSGPTLLLGAFSSANTDTITPNSSFTNINPSSKVVAGYWSDPTDGNYSYNGTLSAADTTSTMLVAIKQSSLKNSFAVRSNTGIAYTQSNLPTRTDFTMCGWFRISTDRPSNYRFPLVMESNGGSAWQALGWSNANTFYISWNGGSSNFANAAPIDGTWFFAYLRRGAGTSLKGGWATRENPTMNTTTGAGSASLTPYQCNWMSDQAAEYINGDGIYFRIWDNELSDEELRKEMHSIRPQKLTGLLSASDGDGIDKWTGNRNNLTLVDANVGAVHPFPHIVQSKFYTSVSASASTISITLDSNTTPDNYLIGFIWTYYSLSRYPTSFYSNNDTGVLIGSPSAIDRVWPVYIPRLTGGEQTYTANLSGANPYRRMIAAEIAGINLFDPLDIYEILASANYGTATDAMTSGSLPVERNNSIMIGAAWNSQSDTYFPNVGTGYTLLRQGAGGTGDVLSTEYAIKNSNSGTFATWTKYPTAGGYELTTVVLKDAFAPGNLNVAITVPANSITITGKVSTAISSGELTIVVNPGSLSLTTKIPDTVLGGSNLYISDVTPVPLHTGLVGVVITGFGFGVTQGDSYVELDGVTQTIVSWSDTSVTFNINDPSIWATSRRLTLHRKNNAFFTYFTTGDEISITQGGGIWVKGETDGTDWHDPAIVNGVAVSSLAPVNPRYSDPIAIIDTTYRTFANNQFAEAEVYIVPGYSGNGGHHEIELLTRFNIASGNAHGYELIWGVPTLGTYMTVVKWQGPLSTYTVVKDFVSGVPTPVSGDILRCEIEDSTMRIYINGSQFGTVDLTKDDSNNSISVWASGQPGMGFWPVDGAIANNMGWKWFKAGDL